jgi:hypothetical protein
MRAALVWSYDLLSEAEQEQFRRLAVFRSSFILDAAAAVAPAVGGGILSVLGGLVDKSLVTVVDGPAGQRRFRLLEPVRQFAAELLEVSGERDDAARRHRDHLQSRLATQGYVTPGSLEYEGLAAEVDNIRAAVEYSLRSAEPEAAIELVDAYHWWWLDLGLVDEHLDRLAPALGAADPGRMSLDVLANALQGATVTATYLGRVDQAAAFVEQLAALRDQHFDRLDIRARWAFAMSTLTRYRAGGDLSQVFRLLRDAQHADEALGWHVEAAYAAGNIPLAAVLWDSVDDPEVACAISDCIHLAQTGGAPNVALLIRLVEGVIQVMGGAGDAFPLCLDTFAQLEALEHGWGAAWGELCVSVAAELVGNRPVAAAHALRWVRFCRRSGVRTALTCGIRGAARLSVIADHPEQALRLWGGAENVETVTGMRYMPLMQRLDRPLLQQCTDALGPDATRLINVGAAWSVVEATQAAEEALVRLQAESEGLESGAASIALPAVRPHR